MTALISYLLYSHWPVIAVITIAAALMTIGYYLSRKDT